MNEAAPTVLASVGTDHHPFDRLVRWVDSWAAAHPEHLCLVQRGTSVSPVVAASDEYVAYDELVGAMSASTVIVSHGGPATIMDARACGRRPVVVPRRSDLGEHVDDHQIRFSRWMADRDQVFLAETEVELHRMLDAAISDPADFRIDPHDPHVGASVRRFAGLVDGLVEGQDPIVRPGVDRGNGVTVMYIGGFGRSGSTLLERVLGQVPGAVAVGEVVHLIERGLLGDQDCGCGRAFGDCPFWTDVGAKAFGGWDRVSGANWMALKWRVDRNRFIPLMIAPVLRRYRRDLGQHCEQLTRLYEAIAEVSGADLIIDSSKQASTAFLMRRVDGIRLRVLHLVRDSRGVAYSWTKQITRPEIRGRLTLMPIFHPARAAARWLSYNALFHLLSPFGTSVTFARYEDLLATPAAETRRIFAAAGHDLHSGDLAFLSDHHVDLAADHSVAGNPMRFLTGRLALRHDSAWRDGLSRSHRWIVTAITAPLLARYGYLFRRR